VAPGEPAKPPPLTGSPGFRTIRISLRSACDRRGLLASEPRAQALRKALVAHPGVRHILPDRVSLDAAVESHVLNAIVRLVEQHRWLASSATIE
jgi:hypothetical protein